MFILTYSLSFCNKTIIKLHIGQQVPNKFKQSSNKLFIYYYIIYSKYQIYQINIKLLKLLDK